jgi:hypothetical protein
MRISHKHKFIFIAIPKTGSTVIRNHLDSYSDVNGNSNNTSPFYHHVKADTLKSYFVENKLDWSSYFKFSFLRNPYARLVSQYYYWLTVADGDMGNHNKQFYENCKLVKKNTRNFNDFVLNPEFEGMHEHPQISWLTDDMNFVGKLENLQIDFNKVCNEIGIPKKILQKTNKTDHAHYTDYYTDSTISYVKKKYADEINKFNYSFGE